MILELPSVTSSFDWILPFLMMFFKNPGLEPIFWSLTSCDSGISTPQPIIFST